MSNEFYVYAWRMTETNEVFYIGKGKGKRVNNVSQRNDYFKRVYKKHDCNFVLIGDNLSEKDAFILEIEAIKIYRIIGEAKCNICNGGEGSSGRKCTEEIKEKIRKSNIGKNIGRITSEETRKKISETSRGRIHTEETKKKMREIATGRKHTNEAKTKIGLSGIGRKHTEEQNKKKSDRMKGNKNCLGYKASEETKKKMSIAGKGKIVSQETRDKIAEANRGKKRSVEERAKLKKAIIQLSLTGEFIKDYKGGLDAQKETGINRSHISSCCSGKRPTAGGYKWEYKLEIIDDLFTLNEDARTLEYLELIIDRYR